MADFTEKESSCPEDTASQEEIIITVCGLDRAVKKFSALLTIAHEAKVGKSDKNQLHTDHEMGENFLEENTKKKTKPKYTLEKYNPLIPLHAVVHSKGITALYLGN